MVIGFLFKTLTVINTEKEINSSDCPNPPPIFHVHPSKNN